MPTPAAVAVELSYEERAALEQWARRPTSAQALALRARIVLAAADGLTNSRNERASRLARARREEEHERLLARRRVADCASAPSWPSALADSDTTDGSHMASTSKRRDTAA